MGDPARGQKLLTPEERRANGLNKPRTSCPALPPNAEAILKGLGNATLLQGLAEMIAYPQTLH